jgi:hypothetical protein
MSWIRNCLFLRFRICSIGGGSLINAAGIAGELTLNATINQTGTAGSTNLLINRTETALGSGEHNFINFQVGGANRWRVDRLGDQYFHDGANYTLISRAPGASGRLRIFRPNSAGAIAVQFGGGNDEMYIGQGSEGSLRVSGTNFALGSAGTLLLDSTTNTFTFRGSASTTMATLTGSGNFTTVGKITGPASTTAIAPLNLPHGVAPTSPVDGDVWTTTTGTFIRINGATNQLQKAITSGTAAPSGGVDGDIYLQYV